MTELILILRRKEMQLIATNTEHREVLSLSPSLFPVSLPCLNFLSFKRVWEQGLTTSREEADLLFSLGQAHTAYNMTCKGNLSPRLSDTLDCWPCSVSDWSDLMEDLDASCLPPAQQTGPVDQPTQLELFWGRLFILGRCRWKDLLGCFSGNWPAVGDAKWQQDHHMRVLFGTCWSGWWGVRAPPLPDNEEGWRGMLCSSSSSSSSSAGRIWLSNVDTGSTCAIHSLSPLEAKAVPAAPLDTSQKAEIWELLIYMIWSAEAMGRNHPPSENIIYVFNYLYWNTWEAKWLSC